MNSHHSPIIRPEQLLELRHAEDFVLIDARFGIDNYLDEHLEGALHVDLNSQLSDIKPDFAEGGRHPLPEPAQFAALLSDLGISPDSHVVVYDDKFGANAAARFWWMLKAIGHNKIQVLDGGYDAAVKAGFPGSSKSEVPKKAEKYPVDRWVLPLADIQEMDRVAQDENYLVIDVRENERYLGKKEPIDLIAGHIPGAVNIPFSSNLDVDGFFLAPDQLKSKYAFADKPSENIVVHCGSGVTACHTLLAMDYAGLEIPKLYVGSWSEWSRNSREIAVG